MMAMALAAAIALTAGVYAADRRGRAGDAIVMGASQIGIAVPNFWLAILLVIVFAVTLRLVPAGGFPGWGQPVAGARRADPARGRARRRAGGDPDPRHALGAHRGAERGFHAHRARKGRIAPRRALAPRAAERADVPILTIMGLQFANLIAGAIVVENVFVLPGLGRLMLQSISNRDTLVVENCVMLTAVIVIGLNFIVDIACAAIDPRLRAPAA